VFPTCVAGEPKGHGGLNAEEGGGDRLVGGTTYQTHRFISVLYCGGLERWAVVRWSLGRGLGWSKFEEGALVGSSSWYGVG